MKKTLLLMVSMMLTTVSIFAQPTKPTVTYSSFANSVGETVYLYNVEAGLFLTGGNQWNTRACVVNNGVTGNGSNYTSYEDFLLGKAQVMGYKWEIGEENSQTVDDVEVTCFSFGNRTTSNYLTADNPDGIWVDGATNRPYSGWYINDLGDNTFELCYTTIKGKFGLTRFGNGDTNTYIEEGGYTTWAVVSEAEYERVQPLLNVYYVATKLNELVESAKALNIEVDYDSYDAIFQDEASTRDDYVAAIELLVPIVSLGESINEMKALDATYDVSSFVAIYQDAEATVESISNATSVLKAVIALKKALAEAQALDATHDYSAYEALYNGSSATSAVDDITTATAIVNAYASLKKALDEATAAYPDCDFSPVKAVYDTAENTTDALAEAEAQIDVIIVTTEINSATLEKPINMTSQLGYLEDLNAIAAGNGSLPKNGWTSTKQSGNFHINTWSIEGNSDGTNMTTPFIEYWKSAGNLLDDQKFYRDPTKDAFGITVPAGAYKITANIRLYNESGAEYMKGAYLFGNLNRTSLTTEGIEDQSNAIDGAVYGTYSGMLLYWKDSFETYAIVPEADNFIFGVQTEGANFNWAASKDWKVYYLGNSFESLDYVRNNTQLLADAYDDNTIAQKSLLSEYNTAVAAYNSANTSEDIIAAYQTIGELVDSVVANAAAYQAYKEKVEYVRTYLSEHDDITGDDVDLCADYVDESLGATEPDETYPNGNAEYILENCLLSTEEISAETTFLDDLLQNAIKNGLADGSDLTDLITNPGFEEAGGKGWSLDTSAGGTKSLTNWHGGNADNYCAEAYEQKFDVYQTIEGVPNGLYEVSVQAFYRTGTNENAYNAYKSDPTMEGDAKVYSYVYLNEFATPVKNSMEILFTENLANNCVEVGTDDEGNKLYCLNGMTSASTAFSFEDESQNFTQKVYGLVTDGKIRLGIRNLENNGSYTWTLWDNFKLKFRAKNVEALQAVLPNYTEQLASYRETYGNDEYMTNPAIGDAENVLAEYEGFDSEDGDELYNALIAVNDALNAAKANVAAVEAYIAVKDKISDVLNDGIYNAKNYSEYEDFILTEMEDYYDLSTAQLIAQTEKAQAVLEALQEPEWENATPDAPIDVTVKIINNGFETGDLTGWTDSGTINAQAQSNTSFDNKQGGYYCEKWHVNGTVDINQTVAKLPAGTYELSAYVYSSADDCYLYVNDEEVNVTTSQLYTVTFYLAEESNEAKFGVKWSDTGDKWTCLDEFTLTYFGSDNVTGIENVTSPAVAAPSAIYSVSGARLNGLQKGLNIVKFSNGTVKKVFVK